MKDRWEIRKRWIDEALELGIVPIGGGAPDAPDPDYLDDGEGGQNGPDLRKMLRDREKQIKEMERRLAEREAADRLRAVSEQFVQVGLNPRAASLYPADLDVTEDAVIEWAESHGMAPSVQRQSGGEGGGSDRDQLLDRYNNLVQQSFSQTRRTPEQELVDEVNKDMRRIRDKRTVPTDAERETAEKLADRVNEINRRQEQLVLAGRRSRPEGGIAAFGGLADPPWYADRTREAREAN